MRKKMKQDSEYTCRALPQKVSNMPRGHEYNTEIDLKNLDKDLQN